MKHIRNYAKVRRMINAYYKAEIRKAEDEIAELSKRDLPTGDVWNDDRRRLEQLKEMIRPAKPLRNGRNKYPKSGYYAWWKRDLDRLEAADRAGVVREITFKIEWKTLRTWGMCPSCETWVQYDGEPQDVLKDHETGKPLTDSRGEPYTMSTHYNPRTYASGCGYDKRSTVMSEGIQCPAVDRLIIENSRCWKCYAVEGKNCLPHLSFGGKGAETLRALFKAYGGERAPIPGFEWEWNEGRTWDHIRVWRTKRRR